MILLDTHVLVWLLGDPSRLSPKAKLAIRDARKSEGGLAISGVTLYEISALVSKGRIKTRTSLERFLQQVEDHFIVKPVTGKVCLETLRLPKNHPKDPMDRIIGATAVAEGIPLITADRQMRESGAVPCIW